MENLVECKICKESVLQTKASEMTPRELAGMQIDRSDVSAATLVSFAISIITFNNPPDSADQPMWWICKRCQLSRLSVGDYSENINLFETIKQSWDDKPKKNWWQFWKK